MNCLKAVRALAISTVLLGSATSAWASPITITAADVGKTFSFTAYDPDFGTTIGAEFDFLVSGFSYSAGTDLTTLTLGVTIENVSTVESMMTSFGINTDPNAVGGSTTSTIFDHLFVKADADGKNTFDVCVENDTNDNCVGNSGKPADGLASGATESFTLTLTFAGDLESVILGEILADGLDGFFARFQGLPGGGSAKAYGQPEGFDEPVVPVPEPASLLLFGVAALAVGRKFSRKTAV